MSGRSSTRSSRGFTAPLSSLDRRVIVLSDHVGRFVAEHGRVWPGKIRRVY